MKIKPTQLFSLLALVVVGLGLLTYPTTIDINVHDTFFVIDYLNIAMLIILLSALTNLCYFIMTRLGKPISDRTGYWHFGLIAVGLLLTLTSNKTYVFLADLFYQPDTNILIDYVGLATILSGPLLLFAGLTVFVIGLFRSAIKRT